VARHEEDDPRVTVEGVHFTETLDEAFVTGREKVPALPWLFESPLYTAVMVTVRTELGVYETVQCPDASEQADDMNVPPLLLLNVTVPVGEFPVTSAVQAAGVPTVTGVGVQETVVFVPRRGATDSEKVPELARLSWSPE